VYSNFDRHEENCHLIECLENGKKYVSLRIRQAHMIISFRSKCRIETRREQHDKIQAVSREEKEE
jgi:hypothetical protein